MPIRVTVISEPADGEVSAKTVVLPDAGGLIGRNRSCDLILNDSSRFVSSRHATLALVDGQILLTDTSSNGTFVNDGGGPVGRGNTVTVQPGDCVVIGDFRLEVQLDSAGESSAGAPVLAGDDIDALLSGRHPANPPAPAAQHAGDELDDLLEGTPAAPAPAPAPRTPLGDDLLADLNPDGPSVDPLAALGDTNKADAGLIGDDFDAGLDDLMAPAADPLAGHGPQRDDQAGVEQQFSAPSAIPDSWNPLTDDSEPLAQSEPPVQPDELAPSPSAARDAASLDALIGGGGGGDDDATVGLAPADAIPAPEPAPAAAVPPPPPPEAPRPAAQAASPPAAPASATAMGSGDALLQGLLRGLGLGAEDIQGRELGQLGEQLGAAVRESIGSLMHVLKARTRVKSEFRIAQTQLMPAANNPLKFSVDAGEALARFFGSQNRGYLGVTESLAQAQDDIRNHEVATMYGMRAAMVEIVNKFAPESIEKKIDQDGRAGLLPNSRSAKCWERYRDRFEEMTGQDFEDLHRRFSETFGKAYLEQVNRLESQQNR